MDLKQTAGPEISDELLDAIRAFPIYRETEHCGVRFVVSPFDIYTTCPECGTRIKLRSFSANHELEDVFDAVFEWMNGLKCEEGVRRRREILAADD